MIKNSYTNPIVHCSEKRNTSDPFVVYYKGYYYHCYSNCEGIFITKATALWKLDENPSIMVYDYKKEGKLFDWYAPELHFINGVWYIYVSPDYGDNLHVMTVLAYEGEDPVGGKYELKGQMCGLEDTWSIDGTPFYYKEQWWFCWTDCSQIYLSKMDGPCGIGKEQIVLTKPEYDFEKHGSPVNEGPAALIRNGKLFIVYSASDSKDDGYCLGLLEFLGDTADEMLQKDKWFKNSSAVFEKTEDAFGPGHCSFTKVYENGYEEDYIVYHANVKSGKGWNGRSIWIQKFGFDEHDRPVFGMPKTVCII